MVHIHQMKRGDLDYDDKNVYWKGKVYPQDLKWSEGSLKTLAWEKEAWSNNIKVICQNLKRNSQKVL